MIKIDEEPNLNASKLDESEITASENSLIFIHRQDESELASQRQIRISMTSEYHDENSIDESESVLAPQRASFTSDIDINAFMV